jgi:uncharacterized iron-regulated membrane protein
MKLKALGKRSYNILFHTHTVAGIVISFALFVIFYAGAFSLFRDEIIQWENPQARETINPDFDYAKALTKVDSTYNLDWHQETTIVFPNADIPFFTIYGKIKDSSNTRMAAYVTTNTYKIQDLYKPLTTVSETIYHLHYFRQIPVLGLYLSGLVSLFFLFAIVTGILIHWKNLFNKFYAFITKGKWKTIWTNAHTVLGVIGLPFQVIYAVTGAFFGLLTLILLPSVMLLYDGDAEAVYHKIEPEGNIELDVNADFSENLSIAALSKKIAKMYPAFEPGYAAMRNYKQKNALITFYMGSKDGDMNSGRIVMKMSDGSVLKDYSFLPEERTYSQSIIDVITKLHFADFGGLLLKIMYFILSMITCFMIISGVLIWRTARDNNHYSLKQRLFHHKVTRFYLAICLSMFPAFALLFIANKLVPIEMTQRVTFVNQIFFIGWLLLTISGLFWNNYSKINRNYLAIGGVLSLFIPIINGTTTHQWFWNTISTYPRVAYVDIFWLITGIISLYLVIKVLKVSNKSNKPTEESPATKGSSYKQTENKTKLKPQLN